MTGKIKPWLVLALIFVVGMVTGAALTHVLSPHFQHPPGAGEMKGRLMMRLTQRLNLTADQQAKIDPILTEVGNQLQAVHREEVGRVSQIMEKTNAQMATILTPEQQTQLQAMQKEMEKDRDRMFPGHKGPWGPHGDRGDGSPHRGPEDGMMMRPPPPETPTNAAPEQKP